MDDGTATRKPLRPPMDPIGALADSPDERERGFAREEAIILLHADTACARAYHLISIALADPRMDRAVRETAPRMIGGNFALRFSAGNRFSRLPGLWYSAQRRPGVYYGDSTVWLRRGTFEQLEWAALSPAFRLHGSGRSGTHTPWSDDRQTVDTYNAL